MTSAGIKRHAFKALLVLHFIGLALTIGVRFANFSIERVTSAGSLQTLAEGRDLMGTLALTLTAPGFWLTIASGIGMLILRYGKNIPGWVWVKVALTVAGMVLALTRVAPALEAARRWAHESAEQGHLLPQLQENISHVTLYGGIVFALILLTIPVAVWKPRLLRISQSPQSK
jgi:hypothetical protein